MAPPVTGRVGRLVSKSTHFLLCDLQEKFRPTISHFSNLIPVAARLIKAANAMQIPIVNTVQYAKALGPTVPELAGLLTEHTPTIDKTAFSMCLPEVLELLEQQQTKSVVLFGIETHICVQQTALDLLEHGLEVHVVADACSSRTQADRMLAFDRMRQSGAFVTTHEAVLFELLRGSTHPNFKEVSRLISEVLPGSHLTQVPPAPKRGLFS